MIHLANRVVKVTLAAMVAEYNRGMLSAAQATAKVGTEAEKLAQKRQAFETLGKGLMVAGAAMLATAALATRAAAQWESAWAGVTKTVDGTPAQMAKVEQGLRDLTKVLPASHTEIAAVAEAAGQLGIQTDNVVAFTKTMIDLGETTNLSANDAATELARFVNIMGTSQSEVTNLGSALVGLGNNYATTESEILAMSMRLAGAGKQVGLTEGDVLGLATALSSVGIEAEAGGSAISKVLIDIAASVDKGGKRLDMFAKVAGVSAQDFAAKWRTAPAQAMELFVSGLANAESQGQSTLGILAELGITEVRMRDALLRSASASDMFAEAMATGNAEFEKNNALSQEAAKRYETVESKLAMAGNAINDMAISFGEVLLPAVSKAADAVSGFADFLGGLPGPIQTIVTVLLGVGGVITLIGGSALIAVPKVAALKVAMKDLGLTMKGLSAAGGAVGLAITGLVMVIGHFAAAQEAATQRAESWAEALKQGDQAVRDMVVANLQAENSFLWWNKGSAFDAAERFGINVETLTDALMGNKDAMAELQPVYAAINGDADAYNKIMEKGTGSAVEKQGAFESLAQVLREQADAQKEGIRLNEQEAKANGEVSKSAQEVAEAQERAKAQTEELSNAAQEAVGNLDDMKDALDGVAGSALAMGDAKDTALGAINALKDAADGEKVSLKGTNDESIKFRDALRDVESAHRDSASAIIENGGTLKDARREWQNGRDAIIDQLTAMGLSEGAAKRWADKNLGSAKDVKRGLGDVKAAFDDANEAAEALPSDLTIDVNANVNNAIATLRTFINRYGKLQGTINYRATTTDGSAGGRATGGAITGPGTATSDSIPIMASNGEHMLTAADVQAMGGQAGVYAFRRNLHGGAARYASGGAVVSRSELLEWQRYVRRGEARSAGMGGNGLDLVDRLFAIAAQIGGKYGKRLADSAYKSEKSFRSLEKQADQAATRLEKAKDKLADLKDAAADMASRVASAVRSFFNVGDLAISKTVATTSQSSVVGGITVSSSGTTTQNATTGSSIASSLKASASKIKSFANKLKRLAKRKLNPKLLEEIALLGVENGEPIVDALLSASDAEIKSINSSYSDISKYSNQAGGTVADANFEKLISDAQKTRDDAKRNADAINRQLEKQTTRLIRGITDALKAGRGIKKADGGPIYGAGTATSDSIPAWLSNGENVWSAAHVQAWGGQAAVERLKYMSPTMPRYAQGGPVGFGASPVGLGLSQADVDRLEAAVREGAYRGTAERTSAEWQAAKQTRMRG